MKVENNSAELAVALRQIPMETRRKIANRLQALANKQAKPHNKTMGLCYDIHVTTNKEISHTVYGIMRLIADQWPKCHIEKVPFTDREGHETYRDDTSPIAGQFEDHSKLWDFRTKNGKRRREFARFAAAFWLYGDQ
ncbi:hypothetical protein [Alteromonas phage ZP6]|uniref:Uncharacterized protein n=1 Tax=Alteromonas phage ZP6 TaxID=2492447 RepID=A0A3S9U896_9CAUD|nr:hypothetical protein PQC03_gp41 [Alteromonas phage ZP6]AZS06544.1 hypothetical protein [Alteromonas phage ZP6]